MLKLLQMLLQIQTCRWKNNIFCADDGDCTVKQDVGDEVLAQTIASAS